VKELLKVVYIYQNYCKNTAQSARQKNQYIVLSAHFVSCNALQTYGEHHIEESHGQFHITLQKMFCRENYEP